MGAASMRPGREAPEYECNDLKGWEMAEASMRPGREAPEYLKTLLSFVNGARSFNEAGARGPGIRAVDII